jgi:hypothetical protein
VLGPLQPAAVWRLGGARQGEWDGAATVVELLVAVATGAALGAEGTGEGPTLSWGPLGVRKAFAALLVPSAPASGMWERKDIRKASPCCAGLAWESGPGGVGVGASPGPGRAARLCGVAAARRPKGWGAGTVLK